MRELIDKYVFIKSYDLTSNLKTNEKSLVFFDKNNKKYIIKLYLQPQNNNDIVLMTKNLQNKYEFSIDVRLSVFYGYASVPVKTTLNIVVDNVLSILNPQFNFTFEIFCNPQLIYNLESDELYEQKIVKLSKTDSCKSSRKLLEILDLYLSVIESFYNGSDGKHVYRYDQHFSSNCDYHLIKRKVIITGKFTDFTFNPHYVWNGVITSKTIVNKPTETPKYYTVGVELPLGIPTIAKLKSGNWMVPDIEPVENQCYLRSVTPNGIVLFLVDIINWKQYKRLFKDFITTK